MIIKDLLKKVNLMGKTFRILVNGIPVNDRASVNETDELFVIPKVSGNPQNSLVCSKERRRLRRLGGETRISPISDNLTELLNEARHLKLELENIRLKEKIERNQFHEKADLGYRTKERNNKAKEYPVNPSEVRNRAFNSHFVPSIISDEYDYLIKIIVVGDNGVGKNALTLQFSKSFSPKDYRMTIGVNFHIKTIPIETKEGPIKVRLQLWDMGDQVQFRSLRPLYYRDSLGAVLVFDLTNPSSFEHLPQWIEDVRYHVKSEIPLLIVGNKSDLINQRHISLKEINAFTRIFNVYYMETSAKTGEGVDDCFYTLACLILGLELPERSIDTEKDPRPPRGPSRDPSPASEAALADF